MEARVRHEVTNLNTARVKRRDPDSPIAAVLREVGCPRCNGIGRPRIVGLAKFFDVGDND